MCAAKCILTHQIQMIDIPMVDDVRNHVNRAKQSLKLSIIDQENAALKVDQWKALCPEAKFLFRPYTCSSEKEEHTETT